MTEVTMVLVLFVVLFVLLAMAVEIGMCLGMIAIIGFFVVINQSPIQAVISTFELIDSFVLTAIPLFVFMGAIFVKSGITRYLFRGVSAWVGRLPGGLALSVVGGCTIFAAMSGSSPATAAAMGTLSLPEMEKYGYSPNLSLGVVAAGGTLGILIPPSITMIVFGAWTATPVVYLFAAGIIPGLILASLYGILVSVRVMLNPSLAPKTPSVTWREKLKFSVGIVPWLVTIVIVLGVIFTGIMTPTEAASMGAVISIILALAYRRMNFSVLREAALMAVRICSMLGLVMGGAAMLLFVVAWVGIPKLAVAFFLSFSVGTYGLVALIAVMYIILGCFIGPIEMMLLTLPFVAPIITGIGYNMVWLGVFLIILSEMAMLTPPVGMNLWVIQSISPKHSIETIARSAMPFLGPMVIMLILLAIWPEIALWLPSMLR